MSTADDMHHCQTYPITDNFCGASLVSPKHAITALHCFRTENDWFGSDSGYVAEFDGLKITDTNKCVYSLNDINSIDTEDYASRLRRIAKIYYPKSWNTAEFSEIYQEKIEAFDVALLEWREAIEISSQRKPVCLPDYKTYPDKTLTCWMTGFGQTEIGSTDRLQEMAARPVYFSECLKYYKFQYADFRERFVNSTCFNKDNKLDATQCAGDSGSGMVCELGGRYSTFIFFTISYILRLTGNSRIPSYK